MKYNLFSPNLTPSQRATIQSLIVILLGAVISGLSVVSDALTKSDTIDYQRLALIAGLTIAFSFGHGLVTYLMAHNADIAPLAELVLQLLEQRFGSLVPSSVQQNVSAPTTQQNAQQGPLVSVHVASPVQPSTPPQNVITAPTSVIPARPVQTKVNLVPLPNEDMPTTLMEVPLQGGATQQKP